MTSTLASVAMAGLEVIRMAGFALTIEGNVGLPSLDIPSVCGQESRKTLKFLQAYNWPANIHELQNVIKRAVILYEERCFRQRGPPYDLTCSAVTHEGSCLKETGSAIP